MKLIVGLGNPGPEYKGTRHNIGFTVVEELARSLGVKKERTASQAMVGEASYLGETVLIAKPLTYMNLSGRAVKSLIQKNRIAPPELIVISDDLDLELGRIRIRPGGGSGGQKGLKSIMQELGTNEFSRLRIGIGRPIGDEVVDYVLTRFNREESEIIQASVTRAAEALKTWIESGIERAMNEFNR
ncbi:MAG: aminoacyl-tRNA hydrolase [Solirubrobacterales bacterium]